MCPKSAGRRAISADGTEERESGEVAEITDLVDLSRWPEGTRMIVRREQPHPGAQLTFTDVDGHRYQVFITDHPDDDICFLEALYRGRGRCEVASATPRTPGSTNLPSASFAINAAWLAVVLIAGDLLAWMKGLCLEGELARAEPKRLRYTLLHTAGVLVRSARRTTLRIAEGWPWADELVVAAFTRLPELVRKRLSTFHHSSLSEDTELIEHAHRSGVYTILGSVDTSIGRHRWPRRHQPRPAGDHMDRSKRQNGFTTRVIERSGLERCVITRQPTRPIFHGSKTQCLVDWKPRSA